MRIKTVYVFENEDAEIMRKAKEIVDKLYNADNIEFDNDYVEQDLLDNFTDIEDMCVAGVEFDDSEDFDIDNGDEDLDNLCDYCLEEIKGDPICDENGHQYCCDDCRDAALEEDDEEEEDE